MVIFHSYVSLPEGIPLKSKSNWIVGSGSVSFHWWSMFAGEIPMRSLVKSSGKGTAWKTQSWKPSGCWDSEVSSPDPAWWWRLPEIWLHRPLHEVFAVSSVAHSQMLSAIPKSAVNESPWRRHNGLWAILVWPLSYMFYGKHPEHGCLCLVGSSSLVA